MGYIGKVTDTAGNTHLVGSTLFGTCSTAAATAAKVVTCSNFSELVEGVTVHVFFSNGNSATSPTLNVNQTGAKAIKIPISSAGGSKPIWESGSVLAFTYYNDYWYSCDTDFKVRQNPETMNSELPILFKNTSSLGYTTDVVCFGNTSNAVPTINPATGNVSAPSFNGHALAAAADKGVDTSLGSGATDSNVPTSAAVVSYVASAVSGGTAFQGSLVQTDSGSSAVKWTQAELEASSYVKGWYWVCEEAGTYAGNVMEVGDMLFAVLDKGGSYSASDFTAVQNNIETLTTTEVSTLWTNAVAVS